MNVTKQFATWANEEKAFRAAAARADAEREAIATQLTQLRSAGARLSVESRQASNALGTHQGQIRALQEAQATLQQQLKEERAQLEDCAHETTAMAETAKQEKWAFCAEMETLNEELMNLLHVQEESGLERLITMDSVTQVLVGNHQQAHNKDGDAAMTNNNHSQDPALNDAVIQLEEATIAYEVVQQELDAYRMYREKLRAQVLGTHQPVRVHHCGRGTYHIHVLLSPSLLSPLFVLSRVASH